MPGSLLLLVLTRRWGGGISRGIALIRGTALPQKGGGCGAEFLLSAWQSYWTHILTGPPQTHATPPRRGEHSADVREPHKTGTRPSMGLSGSSDLPQVDPITVHRYHPGPYSLAAQREHTALYQRPPSATGTLSVVQECLFNQHLRLNQRLPGSGVGSAAPNRAISSSSKSMGPNVAVHP